MARQSFDLFRSAWTERRLCPENYNAETGEPMDQPDTEGFYGWGALMPAMAVGEVMDVDPWNGWVVVNDGEPLSLGPVESPVGPVTLTVQGGVLTLAKGETALFVTNMRGRLSKLRLGDGELSLTLPDDVDPDGYLRLPGVAGQRIVIARIGGKDALWTEEGEGVTFDDLGPDAGGSQFRAVWDLKGAASSSADSF